MKHRLADRWMGDDGTIDAVKRVAGLSPELQRVLDAHMEDMEQEILPTVVAADLIRKLTKQESYDAELFATVLKLLEEMMVDGGEVANLAATGFLEALVNQSERDFDLSMVVKKLGPLSLDFCKGWDEFHGDTTTVDAVKTASQQN